MDVAAWAGEKVVDAQHFVAIRQEALGQMRTDELSTAGDQYAR